MIGPSVMDGVLVALIVGNLAVSGGVFMRLGGLMQRGDDHDRRIAILEKRKPKHAISA